MGKLLGGFIDADAGSICGGDTRPEPSQNH